MEVKRFQLGQVLPDDGAGQLGVSGLDRQRDDTRSLVGMDRCNICNSLAQFVRVCLVKVIRQFNQSRPGIVRDAILLGQYGVAHRLRAQNSRKEIGRTLIPRHLHSQTGQFFQLVEFIGTAGWQYRRSGRILIRQKQEHGGRHNNRYCHKTANPLEPFHKQSRQCEYICLMVALGDRSATWRRAMVVIQAIRRSGLCMVSHERLRVASLHPQAHQGVSLCLKSRAASDRSRWQMWFRLRDEPK